MVESHAVGPRVRCPDCDSSDGLAAYTDKHTHCFACGKTTQPEREYQERRPEGLYPDRPEKVKEADPDIGLVPFNQITTPAKPYRGLWTETCRIFGYGTSPDGDDIATYYTKDRVPVGQKVRKPGKKFYQVGDCVKEALPFGAHLWPRSGKKLVVTEGEIDAMSMSQAQENRWPVVSIACGAGPQVASYFARHREFFRAFDEVILMFDSDSVGSAASITACQSLALPYGRVKIATLPLKDPNEMLQAGRERELVDALWRAVPYRPSGFVDIADIADDILKGPDKGDPWPWPGLTAATYGRRAGEIYTLGAGTGIGKTSTWLQVGAEIIRTGRKVGFILFENSQKDAGLRIASALAGKPFFVPDNSWTTAELKASLSALAGKCLLYDTANADWESCASIMRYWAGAEDCKHIVLDNLSAFSAESDDDRKALDSLMSQLSKLVTELQVTVYLISHLKKPANQATHEEGGRVSLEHFRGSNAIAMFSHFVFGMERNQQDPDESKRHDVMFRVLKDRMSGRGTGVTIPLHYHSEQARLVEESVVGFEKVDDIPF